MAVSADDVLHKPDYPSVFRTFILQTLKQTLGQVQVVGAPLPHSICEQALHILTFALKLDDAWPLTRTLLIKLAPCLEQLGYRDDWLPYLEQGLERSQQYKDAATTAELHLQIGYLHRLCNRYPLAEQHLKASIEAFTVLHETCGQARALNHYAYLAWLQHHYEEAEQYCYQALSVLRESDPARAGCYTTLGEIARVRRQWEVAQYYHQNALQLYTDTQDQRRSAWSLQNLGITLREQGRLTEAIPCYQRALTMLEECQDTFHWAIIAMNLAILLYEQKCFSEALTYYADAESIFRRVNSTLYLAKIAVNKGLVFLDLQEWQRAEEALRTSAALFRALDDIGEALNALDGLGLAYLHGGKPAEASAIFSQALKELHSFNGSESYPLLHQELVEHLAQAQQAQATIAQ